MNEHGVRRIRFSFLGMMEEKEEDGIERGLEGLDVSEDRLSSPESTARTLRYIAVQRHSNPR